MLLCEVYNLASFWIGVEVNCSGIDPFKESICFNKDPPQEVLTRHIELMHLLDLFVLLYIHTQCRE